MVSSWPPRKCGIGTFAEEAMEFIQKREPDRPTYVVSHTDGRGDNVFPVIDTARADWHVPVVEKIKELDPYVVHLQHEYALYEHLDEDEVSDNNAGFIRLMEELQAFPTVVEPHTVHGRMKDHEEEFIRQLTDVCNVLLFKCHYQKWRLDWIFSSKGWDRPRNIMIVPHGARPDRRYAIDQVDQLKDELGLGHLRGKHIIGLVGWIQANKRWDIMTDMWDSVYEEIRRKTGLDWVLLAAGDIRDPNDRQEFERYVNGVRLLEDRGIGRFYRFTPRGDPYYKVMSVCDFVVLPSIDETQSGTLARIIALNKPYITTAPLEGLTAQTLESGGGLLFTNREMLRENVVRLATDEGLRWQLGHNLYRYLMDVVSWEVVAGKYYEAYRVANAEVHEGITIDIPPEF
ncbi:MAG: glycosyltransferase [Planctomycetota bacterium]|jgi:glycosyltransferase involved in cell wall biosynthesis